MPIPFPHMMEIRRKLCALAVSSSPGSTFRQSRHYLKLWACRAPRLGSGSILCLCLGRDAEETPTRSFLLTTSSARARLWYPARPPRLGTAIKPVPVSTCGVRYQAGSRGCPDLLVRDLRRRTLQRLRRPGLRRPLTDDRENQRLYTGCAEARQASGEKHSARSAPHGPAQRMSLATCCSP